MLIALLQPTRLDSLSSLVAPTDLGLNIIGGLEKVVSQVFLLCNIAIYFEFMAEVNVA